jgi:hypothetical protein
MRTAWLLVMHVQQTVRPVVKHLVRCPEAVQGSALLRRTTVELSAEAALYAEANVMHQLQQELPSCYWVVLLQCSQDASHPGCL